jgi:hypothetical protein
MKEPEMKWTSPAVMKMGEGNHVVRSQRWRYSVTMMKQRDYTTMTMIHGNGQIWLQNQNMQE